MRSREVRLGLVLYGGVSLCIYENGIVQEIYRAICGHTVYELICDLIDSEIIVDVISGTSAGGVNGVMLGYALANKRNFLKSAELWRGLGDIEKLMRKPDDEDDSSLLDSTYYQNELCSCYDRALTQLSDRVAPNISELDLFVTGTDAHGVISTVYDDLGHPIDVKNHRAVFQLQYRGGRKNDFKEAEIRGKVVPVTPYDMATLSRLTSGFPVAFKPISIGTKDEDPNFHRWGKLSGCAVYMDGGILNNKPFTTTIHAIASRTATREVERFLIYVEPSPEKFEKPVGVPKTPTIVEAGLWSLTSIPSYQSIAADLQAIEAHNERCLKVQKIIEGFGEATDGGANFLTRVTVVPEKNDPCGRGSYLTARLLLVKDAAVEAILNNQDGLRDFLKTKEAQEAENKQAGKPEKEVIDRRRSGRLLVQSFWNWKGEQEETLDKYDVFYRKRRADYLTGALMTATKGEKEPLGIPLEAWEAVNHFFKLYEMTEWAMKTWMTEWKTSGWENLSKDNPNLDTLGEEERKARLEEISNKVWGDAKKWLDRLMQCDVPVPAFIFTPTDHPDEAQRNLASTREAYYVALRGWMANPSAAKGTNLLSGLDTALTQTIRDMEVKGSQQTSAVGSRLRKEFCRFLHVDRQLLPIQIGSGFESTNVIRVVRFSPQDAQRGMSEGKVEDKVRGTALANFGAFFKKGWRANDIMMGRLDAVCLLTECLLTKERLTAMAAKNRARGTPYKVKKDLLARSLPHADLGFEQQINDYFDSLHPDDTMWEKLIDGIVLAAHKQIVAEEWPEVARCTLQQQYQWGQYQADASLPTDLNFPSQWRPGSASPDEVLVQIAANAISKGQLPPFDPATNKHKALLNEVPVTAMQEHVSLGIVRLGKSLLASVPAGKSRDTVEDNLFFKVALQWVPGFFYQLAHTRRTQPDWLLVPITVILNLALVAVLAFAWMLYWKQDLSLTYTVLATAAVVAAFVAEWSLTLKRRVAASGGMLLALLSIAAIGFGTGYSKDASVSKMQQVEMLFAVKCLVSVDVIALYGMLPLRRAAWRIIAAALAGAVLLELVWR